MLLARKQPFLMLWCNRSGECSASEVGAIKNSKCVEMLSSAALLCLCKLRLESILGLGSSSVLRWLRSEFAWNLAQFIFTTVIFYNYFRRI